MRLNGFSELYMKARRFYVAYPCYLACMHVAAILKLP